MPGGYPTIIDMFLFNKKSKFLWLPLFSDSEQNPPNCYSAQKMKFFIKGSFSKYDQICRKLRIRSHLLKKSLMENFIFCAVYVSAHMLSFAMKYDRRAKSTAFNSLNFISAVPDTPHLRYHTVAGNSFPPFSEVCA